MSEPVRVPPEHIGILLVEAAEAWSRRFEAAMVAAGHPWFAEARGRVFRYVPPEGIAQSALAERLRTTKQAVQQLVDGLVADGIVSRETDGEDARRRRVTLTPAGRAALRDADRIKAEIEEAYAAWIGRQRLETLGEMLRVLSADH